MADKDEDNENSDDQEKAGHEKGKGEGKPVKLGDDWKTALQKFLKRQDNSEE